MTTIRGRLIVCAAWCVLLAPLLAIVVITKLFSATRPILFPCGAVLAAVLGLYRERILKALKVKIAYFLDRWGLSS